MKRSNKYQISFLNSISRFRTSWNFTNEGTDSSKSYWFDIRCVNEGEDNVLWVNYLDVYNNTPVLDIKAYPDWEHGICFIFEDFRVPKWL